MSHTRVLLTYAAMVGVVFSTLGGYVACGAQTYRVPVDQDQDRRAKAASNGAESNLVGIHSSKGWSKRLPIHFKVSSELSEPHVTQLRKAMQTWEAAVGLPLFQFDGAEARRGTDFSSLYAPLDDSTNSHYLDTQWSRMTGKPKNVLASCLWENDPKDPEQIAKSDIRYNTEYYLFGDSIVDFSQGERTIVDLESLALHELGHLLGLSHIDTDEDRYSVMNPSLFIGEGMITRDLSRSDIERIRSIYGIGDASQGDNLPVSNDKQ
jgi:hypothetical protein